jgi:leader peptidase (prepilin peptidase)/N-methyltransferase
MMPSWLVMTYWLLLAFVVGAAVGSFINVCVARLPYEKSLIWPGSRCASCLQPIRLRDNVPLLGYLVLRGRCRTCGARFSVRYFLVELFTGLAFTGLLYLLVFRNVRDLDLFHDSWELEQGLPPLAALALFAHHATLLGFLLVVSLCDLEDMEIPLSVPVTGTLVGLVFATLLPWPWPESLPRVRKEPPAPAPLRETTTGAARQPLPDAIQAVPAPGAYAWPVWYPLPGWLPPGSRQLGLATGLAGALAGMIVLRGVRFVFGVARGIEGMGMGDADLMMMAGAFLGWQPVVVAFFVSLGPGLFFGVVQVARGAGQALPFGPSLSAGVLITLLAWPWIITWQPLRLAFFDPVLLGAVGVAGLLMLFLTALGLRLVRGVG